jgi:hypothetical protein
MEVLTYREFVGDIELKNSLDPEHHLAIMRDKMAIEIGREVMRKYGKEQSYLKSVLLEVRLAICDEREEELFNVEVAHQFPDTLPGESGSSSHQVADEAIESEMVPDTP